MKSIEIMLIPSQLRTLQNMGFEEDEYNEDIHDEAIGFQQGYDIDSMEVESGETFTIDENWEKAVFDCDGDIYILIMKLPWGEPEVREFDDKINFGRGKYKFHEDGKTFELLEGLEILY